MEDKKSFYKRILLFFRPFWKPFSLLLFLMILGLIVGTFSPLLFGKSVDAVVNGNMKLTFLFLASSFFAALIQRQLFAFLQERIEIKSLGDHIYRKFSLRSMDQLLKFSIGQHINQHSGVNSSIADKGQTALSSMMYTFIYNIFPNGLQIVITLIILALFDWKVAVTAAFFLSLYLVVALRRDKNFFPLVEEMRKRNQGQYKFESNDNGRYAELYNMQANAFTE